MPSNAETVDLPVLSVAGLGQMARLDIVQNEKFYLCCNKFQVIVKVKVSSYSLRYSLEQLDNRIFCIINIFEPFSWA